MSISIIIPVHNSMKYLDECLESVLNQIEADDEIILIENGSIDGTPKKCKEYQHRYNNIRYIELGNVGVSVARNEGIKASSKEWITFLDSDDMIQKGAFNRIRNFLTDEAEIIIGGYSRKEIVNTMESAQSKVDSDLLAKGVLQFAKYKRQIQKVAPIDNYNNWACWGKFYSRNFLIKDNILFPSGVAFSEDTAFCFQAYCCAKNIVSINQIVYYYRDSESSVTRSHYSWFLENNLLLLRFFDDYQKRFSSCIQWKKEWASFYSSKLIEICFYLRNRDCNYSLDKKTSMMKDFAEKNSICFAIKNSSYFHLITGKKNSINYAKMLFFLKRKKYEKIFTAKCL